MRFFVYFMTFGLLFMGNVAIAQKYDNGITVIDAWIKLPRKGARVAAGYVTLGNDGNQPIIFVRAESEKLAAKTELHYMEVVDDIMRMRPIRGGITIKPGQKIVLKPGGSHIMLMGLRQKVKLGQNYPITLYFHRLPSMVIEFPVRLP